MPNIRIHAWPGLFPLVAISDTGPSLQFLPVTKLQFTRTLPEWGRPPEQLIQTGVSHAEASNWVRNISTEATLPTEQVWQEFAVMAAQIPFTNGLKSQLQHVGLTADAAIQLDHLLDMAKPRTLAQAMLLEHGTLEWVTRSIGQPLGVMGSPRQEFFGHTRVAGSPACEVACDAASSVIGFRPMVRLPVRDFPI
ncbi:MAG: hypothetical protein ACKO3T_05125 [Planctomycetaceae bacterium]